MMEERGVIGPGSGAKPREILIGRTEDERDNTANLEEVADKMLGGAEEDKEVDENGFEEPENPKEF
jgi:hypothetical protein